MTSPVSTFGQDTFSSSIATSSRAPTRRDQPRELVAAEAHDGDDQRHGQLRQLRAGRDSRKPSSPLLGSPIELISPAGRLPQPRRRVALARLERDRLRDEGVEREALEQGVAEGAPGGDRVEGARPVQDRAARARRRRARSTGRRRATASAPLPRPARSPARPRPAPGRPRRGARSRPGSARRSRSRHRSRTPCPTPSRAGRARRARRTAPGPPRASAAARRRRPSPSGRRRARLASSSVTSACRPTEPSSVATCGSPANSAAACGVRRGAEAEQDAGGRSAVAGAPSSSCQHSSGAAPMPPPTSSGRVPSAGGRKPMPSGPTRASPSSGLSSASRSVPGPTASSRKSSATPSASARARA